MQFNLKNLRDEWPDPSVHEEITYIVAKQPLILAAGGYQLEPDGCFYQGVISYDFIGIEDEGASSVCYSEECDHIAVGEVIKFNPDDEVSYQKVLQLKPHGDDWPTAIGPFNSDKEEDNEDIELYWEYSYVLRHQLFKGGYFPSEFIKPMMRDGLLSLKEPVIFMKDQRDKGWFFGTFIFEWKGEVYKVKSVVSERDKEKWESGGYADLSEIFEIEKL